MCTDDDTVLRGSGYIKDADAICGYATTCQ